MNYQKLTELRRGTIAMMLVLDAYKYMTPEYNHIAIKLLQYAKKELGKVKSPQAISQLEEMLDIVKK